MESEAHEKAPASKRRLITRYTRGELIAFYSRAVERYDCRWGVRTWAGWIVLHRERFGQTPDLAGLGPRHKKLWQRALELADGAEWRG